MTVLLLALMICVVIRPRVPSEGYDTDAEFKDICGCK
jgi:hypothetical protein